MKGRKRESGSGFKMGLSVLMTLLVSAVLYYLWLPPMNIKSAQTWLFVIVVLALLGGFTFIFNYRGKFTMSAASRRVSTLSLAGVIGLTVVMLVGALFSSKLFRAKGYSQILTVQEGSVENIPSVSGKNSIALMDTASAEKLGNREIGSLSDVVSQYDVSEYTQIDYNGSPVKVTALRHAGFFKWMHNKNSGAPGYVVVDPVSMSADYQALSEGMRYIPSAYFSQDLVRHIRFGYPTVMFGNLHFEIDEDGNPWYVASTYNHEVGLFGGLQANGVIIVNPVTGEMERKAAADVPQWVDVVYDGNLICDQYNAYAQLQSGFWNSVIGQSGCRKVTEYSGSDDEESSSDYGYISKDGDIWIYTGVTSVTSDSSNIGFILANERTEETIYIPAAGADEFSAMASAEGEVQEKGYEASFPSLILVEDTPTYIMVLKDSGGLVKMYAAVNVEQYNIVATATTQDACIDKYRALIRGDISQEEAVADSVSVAVNTEDYEEMTVLVKKLRTMDHNGNTYIYIVDDEDHIYKAKYADVLGMLLVEEGDQITILSDGENFALPEE